VHLLSLVAVASVPPGVMIAALGLDAWERTLLGPAEPGRRPGRHRTGPVAAPPARDPTGPLALPASGRQAESEALTIPLPLAPRA
jgi:hypothetical protein